MTGGHPCLRCTLSSVSGHYSLLALVSTSQHQLSLDHGVVVVVGLLWLAGAGAGVPVGEQRHRLEHVLVVSPLVAHAAGAVLPKDNMDIVDIQIIWIERNTKLGVHEANISRIPRRQNNASG